MRAYVFREWESSVKTWQTGKSCQFKLTNSRMNRKKKKNFQNKNPLFHSRVCNKRESLIRFRVYFCFKIFFLANERSAAFSVLLLTDRAKRNSVKRASLKRAERRSAMSSSRFTNRALG